MSDSPSVSPNIPQNVFTLPTPTDITLNPFWTTIQHQNSFLLQKSNSPGNHLFRNLISTIANVLDTKLPPYRILFQKEVNSMCLQIAVSESKSTIEAAWHWIERNMMPEIETIEHPLDKEHWVTEKINMLVTTLEQGTDELTMDESVRNASRTFRQIFDIPHSERLVSYYSCAYKARQGWLYISENYLGFHSFLLGIETKLLLELKDIEEIKKERSKGIFEDSLRLIRKNKEEVYLTNLFKRDEIYDLLVQLTGHAFQRWLRSGSTLSNGTISDHSLVNPLKHDLAARKRNEQYYNRFRLPGTEQLLYALDATYSKDASSDRDPVFLSQVPQGVIRLVGRIYLSSMFLAFESEERLPSPQQNLPVCQAVFPLYIIKRVERIHHGAYTSGIAITTWHKMEHSFYLKAEKNDCELFCEALKDLLLKQIPMFKKVKPFLATFESEKEFTEVLENKNEGGLGLEFGFPENAKDKSKSKLWRLYFQENGRNLTMVKLPTFGKLVRVGLPNLLRGEIWEVTSGAAYLRFANQGVYQEILEKYKDQKSISTEEIEKDLNRSLPEYAGYQAPEGINRLRRVLTAYAWKNPELGYCQAMNIVVSALLIYTTEEQAFWILHILVDRMCPGYYSPNMYGALLDQITFEQLVQKTMPMLWDHFKKTNVELSVASLPWFLSLYVNSIPLEYAVRVLDNLFMEGPRILFQIGLAILKMNGEDLLQTSDDGEFLGIFKAFFQNIDQKNITEKRVKLTKFNEVMLLAYREFSAITNEMIIELRNQNQLKIGAGIESFTKRSIIRTLKDTAGFSKEDIGIIYDKYFGALYYANHKITKDAKMDRQVFQKMLSTMTSWAKIISSDDEEGQAKNAIASSFIDRVYKAFLNDDSTSDGLDFQKVVTGLSHILHADMMSYIDWFFGLYDNDKNGVLNAGDIVDMSKEIYWLLSLLKDEEVAWDAATNLIVGSRVQSEAAKGQQTDITALTHQLDELTIDAKKSFKGRLKWLNDSLTNAIDISLPSFRMVVLTNEMLEMFFDHGFVDSFKVVQSATDDKSLGRELFESLFAEGQTLANKKKPTHLSPPRPRSSSSASSDLPKEVDNLMDEWDHFDV